MGRPRREYHDAVRNDYLGGQTGKVIASRFGISLPQVYASLRLTNTKRSRASKYASKPVVKLGRQKHSARNLTVLHYWKTGHNLNETADKFGFSRQRAYQIIDSLLNPQRVLKVYKFRERKIRYKEFMQPGQKKNGRPVSSYYPTVHKLFLAGMTRGEIVSATGLTKHQVEGALRRRGLRLGIRGDDPRREQKLRRQTGERITPRNAEFYAAFQSGLTSSEVARKFGVSKTRAHDVISKVARIKRRTPIKLEIGEPRKRGRRELLD